MFFILTSGINTTSFLHAFASFYFSKKSESLINLNSDGFLYFTEWAIFKRNDIE